MWICNKNKHLINVEKVKSFNIVKGKNYYDDDAVLNTYHYICADGNKIIKTSSVEEANIEFENIINFLNGDVSVYNAGGIEMVEDDNGNLLD